MKPVRQKRGLIVTIGGDQHRGWLPAGAALPLPEPIREVALDLSIEEIDAGFLVITSSADRSISGDTWHETLASAERAAFEAFGITPTDWD